MYFKKDDINKLDRNRRIRLINSISGPKSANLIGTIDDSSHTNLAIISSVIHLGSDPPLLGFILRPNENVRRDTYDNILLNQEFTINHVNKDIVEQSHWTSAKFSKEVSEFDVCNLTVEFLDSFSAPFVKESNVKIGLKLVDQIDIKLNQTKLIIGEINHIMLEDNYLDSDGSLNLSKSNSISVCGLNSYYRLNKYKDFPYSRVEDLPDFK